MPIGGRVCEDSEKQKIKRIRELHACCLSQIQVYTGLRTQDTGRRSQDLHTSFLYCICERQDFGFHMLGPLPSSFFLLIICQSK